MPKDSKIFLPDLKEKFRELPPGKPRVLHPTADDKDAVVPVKAPGLQAILLRQKRSNRQLIQRVNAFLADGVLRIGKIFQPLLTDMEN